jgi:hypothetical protein
MKKMIGDFTAVMAMKAKTTPGHPRLEYILRSTLFPVFSEERTARQKAHHCLFDS